MPGLGLGLSISKPDKVDESGPPPSDFSVLITEDDDALTTEDGNLLTTE